MDGQIVAAVGVLTVLVLIEAVAFVRRRAGANGERDLSRRP